jgi:hypothetical protein
VSHHFFPNQTHRANDHQQSRRPIVKKCWHPLTQSYCHGQLYVTLSRATSSENVHISLPSTAPTKTVVNIVYPEVLLDYFLHMKKYISSQIRLPFRESPSEAREPASTGKEARRQAFSHVLRTSVRAGSRCRFPFFSAQRWLSDFRSLCFWPFQSRRSRRPATVASVVVGGAPLICARRHDVLSHADTLVINSGERFSIPVSPIH